MKKNDEILFETDNLIEVIKSICKQTLELASENVRMCINDGRGIYSEFDVPIGNGKREIYTVDKNSILNIINLIK